MQRWEIAYNTLGENVIERMLTTGIRSVYSLGCFEILYSVLVFLNTTTQKRHPKHGGVLFNLTANGIFLS